MDQPIRPKPSNAHKPRVRLPVFFTDFPLYRVSVPRFQTEPLNQVMVRLVVIEYVTVACLANLTNAMLAAVEYAKFKEIRFGGGS